MFKSTLRFLMIGLLIIGATSCNPEEDTIVIITVVDEDNAPQDGALVKLFADPNIPLDNPTRLNKEATTDLSGQAVFDYTEFYKQGQSGFAVLDILATKDTLVGEDIIKVLEEEVNEKIVVLE